MVALAACLIAGIGLIATAVGLIYTARQPVAENTVEQIVPEQAFSSVAAPDPVRRGITTRVDDEWVREVAEAIAIPQRAMLAYVGASIAVAERYPNCHLGWNTLAGIGYVESAHGTMGGGYLNSEGQANPAIVGVPLDGISVDSVPDTDQGTLDGDPIWDRALGPMQFIPSTWEQWGQDGNLDSRADPQNIDDAALAAGLYLCDAGRDLSQPDEWIDAVRSYNDATSYVNSVASAANHYAQLAQVVSQ